MSFNQFTKLSLICNCCFLITLLNHFKAVLPEGEGASTIVILGQLFAVLTTVGYFVSLFFFLVKHKLNKEQKILLVLQVIFLFAHIYYYFFF